MIKFYIKKPPNHSKTTLAKQAGVEECFQSAMLTLEHIQYKMIKYSSCYIKTSISTLNLTLRATRRPLQGDPRGLIGGAGPCEALWSTSYILGSFLNSTRSQCGDPRTFVRRVSCQSWHSFKFFELYVLVIKTFSTEINA